MKTFNPLSRPMYEIPVGNKTYGLYKVYCSNNLVVLMSLDFAGTQFYVSQRKRSVKIVIPPVKGLDRDPNLIVLYDKVCQMYHAKMVA